MNKITVIILLLGISFLGYYTIVFEPNNIQIEKQVIAIENLPQRFDGVKIVQLSDFHSLWFGSREKKVLEMLEKLNPDFIFITGDFVDPMTKDLNSLRLFWQELGKKYQNKIYGVLGNHDSELVKRYLRESGITILDNENKKLFFGNEFIFLIGVNDPWTDRDDLSKAIKGVENNLPKILLAHSPDIIDEAKKKKIDLVLTGHTHGGQVRIPFFGPLWIPSKYGRKYDQGLFKIDLTYLYINQGIGTFFLPIRFNCPPEITLIELQKKIL